MCLNCETACPEDVIKFRFLPNRKSAIVEAGHRAPHGARRGRRRRASHPGRAHRRLRSTRTTTRRSSARRARSRSAQFLERCIRCAECMKVCPNNALHPAFFEAGIEGMWTPILIPRIGYCEHSCVLCGQVCPTGAIQKITEKQKLGHRRSRRSKIGTAFYDHGRCLPWAMADAVHRLRRVLPDVAQGDLGRRGRSARSATRSPARTASRRR